MPKSGDWNNFLRNGHNKTEMIKALVQYYKTDEKTWSLTATGVEQLPSSNHIEADTRIILEASKSSNTVIVRGADTDILVLLCYTHSILNCVNRWVMKIDSERFVDINIIRGHYGNDICKILPAYHSLTGCDSTSYPVNVGKIKPFKILIREASLLSEFGSSAESFHHLDDAKLFVQTLMYSGTKEETVTETRTKMYMKQKIKSSSTLIPDESSLMEHLRRADLQTYIWKQCVIQNMAIPALNGRGWVDEEGKVSPVWF